MLHWWVVHKVADNNILCTLHLSWTIFSHCMGKKSASSEEQNQQQKWMNLSTKIRRQTRESCHCFFVKNRSYHKKCTLTNSQDSTSFLHENAVTIRGQILTAQRATSSSLSTAIAMGFAKSRTVHTFILKLHSLKNWLWIAMKMVEKINYGNGFYKIKNSAANQPFIDRPRSARWNAKPKNFLIIKMDFATIGAALHFTNSSQDRWSRRPWMVPDLPFSCVHCLSINLIGKWQWWWRVQTINSCEYQFFPDFCWHSGYTLRLVWYC